MNRKNPFACYDRAFMARVLAAATGMVLLSLVTKALGLERGSALRIAIGFLQAALLGYAIGLSIRSLRKLDELQYRIQLEAVAFAFAASAIVIAGWGFMTKAGLPPVQWGPETWLLMVLLWAIGLWLQRRRYQ